METLGTLLFDGFELLDVFGPLEVLGDLKDELRVLLVGPEAGPVTSAQGQRTLADVGRDECPPLDVLLVPGGIGTRRGVDDAALMAWIRDRASAASVVMSVCTGSGLLARAGVLDGRRATSNKRAFDWAASQGPNVEWIRRARWVHDGKYWTSSGVSAGIDMTLAFVAERRGRDAADATARRIEYEWHRDPDDDPFA
jgi:putative intracellular protease/amidase